MGFQSVSCRTQRVLVCALQSEISNIEAAFHRNLRSFLDEPTYRMWLSTLRVERVERERVELSLPQHAHRWVQQRFAALIAAACEQTVGHPVEVLLQPAHGARTPGDAALGSREPSAAQVARDLGDGGAVALHMPANPRLSFEQFIIGESNRFAHCAALTVAESPGVSFNPLYIYGPPGVGKSHLLHAISLIVVAHSPGAVVRLTAGEPFTSAFVSALQGNRAEQFKAELRHVDALLIDDLQFIAGKRRTEEEFLHTFDAITASGGQMVISADRAPQELCFGDVRLTERLQSGLVARIGLPEPQTRRAILRKRLAERGQTTQGEQVVDLIAERVPHSVRSLEGALTRVIAYSSLTNRTLDVPLAEELLDAFYAAEPQEQPSAGVGVPDIQRAICGHFGISAEDLVSGKRSKPLIWPRQLAMLIAREMTSESLPAIGRMFGGRDHSTVMHACRRATERLEADPAARLPLEAVKNSLRGQGRA